MRTTHRITGTTGKTRRAPVATTLAAVCLALPMSGLFGGTAFATNDKNAADHGSSSAPGQAKKADNASTSTASTTSTSPSTTAPAANQNTSSTPYTNAGGVTTGSNTTKYEVANGRSGSPAVGGGQPSGNVYSPQPYSNADQNNTGANDTSASNPYKSTRDGSPSLNGNGGGKQVGQPCAGCVGKADNKNPPGQAPNATDKNAGYECDRNHGIGRSNPAHTGCTSGTTPPPPSQQYCPDGKTPMPAGGAKDCPQPPKCPNGQPMPASGKCDTTPPPSQQYCPDGKTPMPAGGAKDCPQPPKCPNGQPMPASGKCDTTPPPSFCPDGKTPMPAGGAKDCPQPPKTCPGGTPMPASGDCGNVGGDNGGGNKNDKITICHATGSATNPFVVITPNKNGVVHGHAKHADDIIPPFSYNDHGVTKQFPGLNWTAANQASFANGCHAPQTPVVCPSGSTMVNGHCETPVVCPSGSTMVNGTCTPPPSVCPAGSTMVNGHCETPAVCPAGPGTMVNGVCVLPTVCPAGTTPMPNGTCVSPITDTPGGGATGGTPGGGTLTGTPGGGATGGTTPPVEVPTTTPVPTTIGQGSQPQPVLGGTITPGRVPTVISSRPTALPFTGANATLLGEGAALMLLIGGGLVVATRKKKAVIA